MDCDEVCETGRDGLGPLALDGAGAMFVRPAEGPSLDGRPPGPPGFKSLPLLIGFRIPSFPRGVGRDTDSGGSPGPV